MSEWSDASFQARGPAPSRRQDPDLTETAKELNAGGHENCAVGCQLLSDRPFPGAPRALLQVR